MNKRTLSGKHVRSFSDHPGNASFDLQKANINRYVSADWEQGTFNVGQTLFPEDPVYAMSLVPFHLAKDSPASTVSSLESGAIAGIVIGAFVLLMTIAALTW